MLLRIEQRAACVPRKAVGFQQGFPVIDGGVGMLNVRAKPELVAGADVAPDWSRAAAVNEAHHAFAIYREGNSFAEFQIAEPLLFRGNVGVLRRVDGVHIEQEENELETGTD